MTIDRVSGWLSKLGLFTSVTAFVAASCCVLPFVFIAIGLTGGWLSVFDIGLMYREQLQLVAAVSVGIGWVAVGWRRTFRRPMALWLGAATLALCLSWIVWNLQGEIRTLLLSLKGN